MDELIRRLPGPIVILGAAGFIGRNMAEKLCARREDVRLANVDNWQDCFDGARTVFNFAAHGAYPDQNDTRLIYESNFLMPRIWLDLAKDAAFIHAGSSSEYGANCAAPREDSPLAPNSDYAVSKVATSGLIWYMGKHKGRRCCNLRLYSVYGKYERETRLVPTLIREGRAGRLPPFVNPDTSRDFIHVDDVCRAFLLAALNLTPEHYGEAFNIGTGVKTTIREVTMLVRRLFSIDAEPQFTMMPRRWDCAQWYANPEKAKNILDFSACIAFEEGVCKEITNASGQLSLHMNSPLAALPA